MHMYLHIFNSQLCIFLFCLQLQLDVEQGYPGLLVLLGLHLKPSIGEGLLEAHASDETRVLSHGGGKMGETQGEK